MHSKTSSAVFLLLVILGLSTQISCQTNVTISFSARNLPNFDIFDGPPDPYMELTLFEGNTSEGTKIGQTDAPANTQNPNWTTVFSFNYKGGLSQKIKFDLWDEDVNANDYMGYVEVPLANIASAFGGIYEVPFLGDAIPGHLIIKATINGTSA